MIDSSPEVPLQPSVEQLIAKICTDRCIPSPDVTARRSLSKLTPESAIEILNKIAVSKQIREFSRFIVYMVKKTLSVTVSSPEDDRVLPQKRSPPFSFTDGTPQKCAHFVSPNSKQVVEAPGSSSNYRTIPEYFPRSPNDGYGSLISKKITFLPHSGLEGGSPNDATCRLVDSSKGTNLVPKQLVFSTDCDLDDTNHSNVCQQLFDSSNDDHRMFAVQKQHTLPPCSTSKGTHNCSVIPDQRSLSPCTRIGGPTNILANHGKVGQHLFDSSNDGYRISAIQNQHTLSPCSTLKGTHNCSVIPDQCSLSPCASIGGPTNILANHGKAGQHLFDSSNSIHRFPVVKKQQTFSPCSTSNGTHASHFYDISIATHNGSPIPDQRCLSPCVSVGSPTNSLAISQQSLLLNELEFRKLFLVYSYVGRKKLEDVVSVEDAIEIKKMKTLSMLDFEAKIWAKYGCRFCEPCDRAMHLDWDSGKTHLYHCYVSIDGTYQFKGPYLNPRRTHLQRELGDDNVLIIQFADDPNTPDIPPNQCNWFAAYNSISDGISIGLRHYRLFAFKDVDKKFKGDNSKKKRSKWAIKCYFIRTDSRAPWAEKDGCILFGKTSHEARCLFMHAHMVSSMAKYISRCSLALSNTIKLRVDLTCVHVERIEDIPCRDENGYVVCNEDGEPLIHTDGTGFISEDLAILCEKDFIEAKGTKEENYELKEESLGINGKESCIKEPPLLVQCRLFKDGYAVKGTLLVNKKLKPRTIQVRPSMIKVEKDTRLSNSTSFSSLEINSVSRRPRTASLSKNLIALLSVGGVPKNYFLELLENTLQDGQKVSSSMRAAVRVGLNYGQMDDSSTSVAMIGCGIPLEEPYLQFRLSIMANEERKALRSGKIPVNESYYVIGTADPTGTLNSDEVCVILDNGQISGKVLVYRNPGLDFGDVHIMNAKYVEKMEEFVGNAKYGIFFSTKGKRSVGTEIANGDFDGDTYWVCRNPQLLHYFKASEPWQRKYSTPKAPSKKPSELSPEELESELFSLLFKTQKHSMVAGRAADSWQAFMDQYLVLGENDVDEKRRIKEKLLKLADLYYDALDAPKSGKSVDIPQSLLPRKYPHYLEKFPNKSYSSSSVLGEIYDRAMAYQPDNALIREIWKLPCFNVEIPDSILSLWKNRYDSYRHEMSSALQSGDESKNNSADIVMNKYKKMLYEAENFASSTRKIEDIYNDALAIYHVSYDYAIRYANVAKCGFAWKVAGEALCSYHESKTPGRSISFKMNVLSKFI
ncbi:probable RNA-dependent RNA polymerase 3 isoform X2 [Helianthus annuus]|uniref:probable RNA-dependent RNA polymerase 3 isoform X2 n=1 Tax=Helianthus annuus TaxID=4232 RepID=UPI000B904D3B|nr:probable RNA-dependent RNA polymerase 3 isoform X2 [Helianthus annuus]